jgi:hypothetical protein
MAQYMLSVHGVHGQSTPSRDEMERMLRDVDTFNAELQADGGWVFACGLHPIETATVVEVKDGRTVTTDGPFAESKEFLGGFWIVNADDLDAALALAERGSAACQGPVEVRPLDNATDDELLARASERRGD